MKTRRIGDMEIGAVGLGCMSMSFGYGAPDEKESEQALHRALDVGYTFLDTASAYGLGHNEKLIGRVLKDRRDEYTLASKCGILVLEDGGRAVDCTPENVRKTCEESLKNLQTDVIDLYYLHRKDQNVPIEESVGAVADMVKEGKVRHIGLSEVSSITIRKAHAEHPITALQSEYSLWTRDPEGKVLDACRELGIGFVPFSPLGRAFLSGKVGADYEYDDYDIRSFMPRFSGDNLKANLALVRELETIAADNNCTAAQLSLAWVLAQDDNFVPIPGTKHVSFVEENAAAAELNISTADLQRAGEIFAGDAVQGPRYAPGFEVSLDPE